MSNSFISSHEALLEEKGRLRVAEQLHTILVDWYGDALKNLKVLDYGCSNGMITNFVAKYFKTITGVDVDELAIKEAKTKFKSKNITFLLTQDEKLPFKNNSYNLVICNQVYSYLDNPKLMINEIYRVLQKGGICLLTGDNLLRPIEPLYNLPFIRLLPRPLTESLLKLLGHKNIYLGKYKTYWGLKNLCRQFEIYDYTVKVLKNPSSFRYKNLEKYSKILSITPSIVLKIIEPFFPSFIFILKKS